MSEKSSYRPSSYRSEDQESNPVIGFFWLLLFLGTLFVAGPFAAYHAFFLGAAGLLMIIYPPKVQLPRLWWVLAGIFVVAGLAQFLPASWFTQPAWRAGLEAAGVKTGSQVVIQVQQAVETYTLFVAMLFTGLWLAGQRVSGSQLRFWALVFAGGVAVYAVFSKFVQSTKEIEGVYGFFPNRNHTATLLAMGAMCGLGSFLQAMRDKRPYVMGLAIVATLICLWAIGAWSISRAGILLITTGSLFFFPMLGIKYLGYHTIKVLGLIVLLVLGAFFILDSNVKNRISETQKRVITLSESETLMSPTKIEKGWKTEAFKDFRLPIARDTLDLINDFKWTGVGAGQFRYVFLQYEKETSVNNTSQSHHPESDWLWMASEVGIIATLALASMVVMAFWKAGKSILGGNNRAVRTGCMVAALLVPLHGILDVPGHRIVLASSSFFLFFLCFSSSKVGCEAYLRKSTVWFFRGGGLSLVVIAGYLTIASLDAGVKLARESGVVAYSQALQLYQKQVSLFDTAVQHKEDNESNANEDYITPALQIMEDAKPVAPLESALWLYQSLLGAYYEGGDEETDKAVKVMLALEPTSIEYPLLVAEAWATLRVDLSYSLFQVALKRADRLDEIVPGYRSAHKDTLENIRRIAKGKPELEAKIANLK